MFIAIADGCTGECATMESPTPADSRDKLGMMYMLDTGPSLYVANGELTSVKPESSDEEVELKMIPMVEIEATRQE